MRIDLIQNINDGKLFQSENEKSQIPLFSAKEVIFQANLSVGQKWHSD
jgi:hypothetical protein